MRKEFKSKKDKSTVTVYEKAGNWFYKHTPFQKWIKKAQEVGPFKNEGDALLSACMSREFKFSEFKEITK